MAVSHDHSYSPVPGPDQESQQPSRGQVQVQIQGWPGCPFSVKHSLQSQDPGLRWLGAQGSSQDPFPLPRPLGRAATIVDLGGGGGRQARQALLDKRQAACCPAVA